MNAATTKNIESLVIQRIIQIRGFCKVLEKIALYQDLMKRQTSFVGHVIKKQQMKQLCLLGKIPEKILEGQNQTKNIRSSFFLFLLCSFNFYII